MWDLLGYRAHYVVTADGKTSSGKECHVVESGLENLGVYCLLGVNVVDLMGAVAEEG